jgi:hypothetical protein
MCVPLRAMVCVFLLELNRLEAAAEAPRLPASLPRCSWPCKKCSDTSEAEFTLDEPYGDGVIA